MPESESSPEAARARDQAESEGPPEVWLEHPRPRLLAAGFLYRALSTPLIAAALLADKGADVRHGRLILGVAAGLALANLWLTLAAYRGWINRQLSDPRFFGLDGAIATGVNLWAASVIPDRSIFLIYRDLFWIYFTVTIAIGFTQIRRRVLVTAVALWGLGLVLQLVMATYNDFTIGSVHWNIVAVRLGWLALALAVARYLLWVFREGGRAGADLLLRVQEPQRLRDTFRRGEDGWWTIAFAGKAKEWPHSVGLERIAWLLAHPDRETSALELVSPRGPWTESEGVEAEGSGFVPIFDSDAGEILDPMARARFRERHRELTEMRKEAKASHDSKALEKLEWEIEWLRRKLAEAKGRRGGARRAASAEERARIAVYKSIRSAELEIASRNPKLALHLGDRIKTGKFCIYRSSPGVNWDL